MSTRRFARILFQLAALALIAPWACGGDPLPDPPSADPAVMSLTEASPETVRLTGAAGAILLDPARPLGATLRVSNPRLDGRVLALVEGDGSFEAIVEGATTDTLYLELVEASRPEDRFLLAVEASGGAVVAADEGPDGDADLSPDAIDCAPDDATRVSRACSFACVTDSDCDPGLACVAGACTLTCAPLPERCGNALDDDCDGAIDEVDCR